MGYVIIFPPYCLLTPTLLLAICFAVFYAGKNRLKINREEILNPKGSILSLVFKVWVIDLTALFISAIIMLIVSSIVPLFSGVNSEWGIAFEHAYFPAVVYILSWSLLYGALFSSSYYIYGSEITNKWKSKKLFFSLIIISVIIWEVLMSLLFLIPWWD